MNKMFTTQSGNFMSAMETQVDPRTGQFMVNLPLVHLVGNSQLGPDLSLGLSYSPLSEQNQGFGTGFCLGFTGFDAQTHLLQLSNGEQYRVIPGTDTVRNHKLNHFRFAYKNEKNNDEGYTVFWKEGKQEHLSFLGGDAFVTTEITSPLGRTLSLFWDWNGTLPILNKITDESITLCQLEYAGVTTMTMWPDTADAYRVTFKCINDQLDSVSRQVSDNESLTWSFLYDTLSDETQHLLLTEVHYPTGMTDRVDYNQQEGLQFPSKSNLSRRLPVVLSHVRSPGGGQPDTHCFYEYTEQNFLGYNGDFGDWSDDSDYLYTTLTDYTYGSTETVSDGKTTVKTVRTYNNYHLQIAEETSHEGCVHRVEFMYYAKTGYFIDAQPKQFECIKEKKEMWIDEKGESRSEVTETAFDESGNPILEVAPNGTKTEITWYPATGETGCPKEPNGFTRFIKKQTVTPFKTDYDAPVMTTEYQYRALNGDSSHIVQDSASDYANDVLLHRRTFSYMNRKGEPEYGRIGAITDSMYETKGQAIVSRQEIATAVKDGVMSQTVAFIGHDGIRATSMREQSISGLLLVEKDAQGVMARYTYDKMGRILTKSIASRTEYETVTKWSYTMENGIPVTTQMDGFGNQLKTFLDGAGRKICTKGLDGDKTQQWFELDSRTYDVFGDVAKERISDWLTQSAKDPIEYKVDATVVHDRWGAPAGHLFSNGKQTRQEFDPIGCTQSTWMEGELKGKRRVTAKTYKELDQRTGLPLRKTFFDASGVETEHCLYDWDGLGRLRREVDGLGEEITRTYDAYGRLLTQRFSDSSEVIRTYAPHLKGEQVDSIRVVGLNRNGEPKSWLLGTQQFDSLGRLTKQAAFGRVTTFRYEGASPVPSLVTLPSGKKVAYTYIPELGNGISRVTTEGIAQTFEYEKKTGELVAAKESDVRIDTVWSRAGLLTEEHFSRGGTSRKARYDYTLKGEVVTYTDVAGKQTSCTLDEYGKVIEIVDEALRVDLTYDPLGRLHQQIVKESSSPASVTTAIDYNDFGLEVKRTVTDSRGLSLVVSQTWKKNSLLESRVTEKKGEKVREETYQYDCRKRLIDYQVSGSHLPVDGYGHGMTHQTYCYDALSNLLSVETTLSDGTKDTATYLYENPNDPTQLTTVTHTHEAYPKKLSLSYDSEGRMVSDEANRTLRYDALGRLTRVNKGTYHYDALNRLTFQNTTDNESYALYYRGAELVNEVTKRGETRFIKSGHTCLGVDDPNGLTLTASDQHESLLWSENPSQKEQGQLHVWSPYGTGTPEKGLLSFNGERVDPVSGTYHLGNGYRAYNPVLMRFNCPDGWSPFGAGGINPYAYCAGDPINHTDPSGHMSWQAILGITMGAIGLGLAAVTAGASIAVFGGVMAAISAASTTALIVGSLAVVSDVTAIASGALEDSNPEASSTLGWVSLATGIPGMIAGIGGAAKGVRRLMKMRNLRTRGKIFVKNAKGRKPQWHEIENSQGGVGRFSDQEVTFKDVKEQIESVNRRPSIHSNHPKGIVVLSGAHGRGKGNNWVKGFRDQELLNPTALIQDLEFAEEMIWKTKRTITVIDCSRINKIRFQSYLLGPDHVIAAFCFSRNDDAVIEAFGIKKILTFTNDFKSDKKEGLIRKTWIGVKHYWA